MGIVSFILTRYTIQNLRKCKTGITVNYNNKRPQQHGITLKKQYGQHFLRDQSVVDNMIEHVTLTPQTSVFEIGCGDGFLTRSILQQDIARLWVFEIDPEWATHVRATVPDKRLTVFEENFLDLDFQRLAPNAPWTLLANLPYQVTFPIIHKLRENRHLLKEGVVMMQEEVAQKIVKTEGRGYGFPSLFLQHCFELKLLKKISPGAFFPPPKVYSRLLYFKPKAVVEEIPHEQEFWRFIKLCFHQPRRTLKNNLEQSHFDLSDISAETLQLRAQQMSMQDLLQVWCAIKKTENNGDS